MSGAGAEAPVRGPHTALVAVLAGYALSRAVFAFGAGVEFDASTLPWFWQYLDPALLRDDALRSLYYLHSQPPLYNAGLAAALKLGGAEPVWVFRCGHLLLGALLHASIYWVLSGLSVRSWLAASAAIAFAFSPASILYENWLFYSFPVATLLIAATAALLRAARRSFPMRDMAIVFGLLAAVALTRSLFHLLWLALAVAGIAAAAGVERRHVLLAAAAPLLLVLALYAKNGLAFGSFSASSWLGMNMARVVVSPVPMEERAALVREGRISEVSLVSPFAPLKRYPKPLRRPASMDDPAAPHHPALEAQRKSTKAHNLNHVAYLDISRLYASDALTLLADSPGRYFDTLATGWLIFGLSPAEYWFLEPNRSRIAGWDRLWSAFVYGVPAAWSSAGTKVDRKDRSDVAFRIGYLWMLLAIAALGLAIHRGVRDLLDEGGDRARGICLLFMASNVLWVAIVGNALDYRENNRIRFVVEPMIVVMIAWAIDQLLRARDARPARR